MFHLGKQGWQNALSVLSFSLPFPTACHRFFAPPLRAGAFLSFIAQAPSSASVFRLPWREILLPRQLRHPLFKAQRLPLPKS